MIRKREKLESLIGRKYEIIPILLARERKWSKKQFITKLENLRE